MNIVCIGAHPDDCEFFAGGTALKWVQQGANVLFVSLTNGDKGHFEILGPELARRRIKETEASAKIAGVTTMVLDIPDGELMPTLELRKKVVDIIRQHDADVVLTHRPNDYHPDHRYTSLLVQDAAFMVTVPGFSPDTPRCASNPFFFYFQDLFTKPTPFSPDVSVSIDDVIETKWLMLAAMESQVYEWLPWLDNKLDEVPKSQPERLEWLKKTWRPFFAEFAQHSFAGLERRYGTEKAQKVQFAESFEICEYGRKPTPEDLESLFPL
ncbi:MAG TPA: PIG-L family deacetylase [Candidatus Hydrogenedentes bacterium]|nr:PIG-L family deacetylase [Candidatus Hydrogenedentota bacterium]HOL77360.1 PIG-L family deacetylase [Candidatus Hydrogenedentota bacterium]HPO84822.1 PIG-L family deacetylase [Candidatus Hydrogenedentota bacterium]